MDDKLGVGDADVELASIPDINDHLGRILKTEITIYYFHILKRN